MVRGTKIQKGLIKRKNSFYTYLSKQNKILALVEWPKSTSLEFQSEAYPYLLIYIYIIYIGNEINLSVIFTFQEKQMNDQKNL
jgi:hypothetical protein